MEFDFIIDNLEKFLLDSQLFIGNPISLLGFVKYAENFIKFLSFISSMF